MTWIETLRPDDEHPELRDVFERLAALVPAEYLKAPSNRLPVAVRRDSITRAHSLMPTVMFHVFAAHAALMDDELPLSRRDHELISTVVSRLNDCFY